MPEGFGIVNDMAWLLDHAFSSQVMLSPLTPQVIWGVATIPARTAGLRTYIFEITITNGGCDDGIVVIGNLGGVLMCPAIFVPKNSVATIEKEVPIDCGDQDVYIYANQGMMHVQIKGVEY